MIMLKELLLIATCELFVTRIGISVIQYSKTERSFFIIMLVYKGVFTNVSKAEDHVGRRNTDLQREPDDDRLHHPQPFLAAIYNPDSPSLMNIQSLREKPVGFICRQ